MIDERYCTYCAKLVTKVYSHMNGVNRIYTDQHGKFWSGARCPECYASYKKNYDAARRLKKGHTPLNTICVCEKCSKQFELKKGYDSKVCSECRVKD